MTVVQGESKKVCLSHSPIGISPLSLLEGNFWEKVDRKNVCLVFYQTEHFFSGFILDPRGQLKLSENSLILLMGPITLNLGGEWDPTSTRSFNTSDRYLPHQTWYIIMMIHDGGRENMRMRGRRDRKEREVKRNANKLAKQLWLNTKSMWIFTHISSTNPEKLIGRVIQSREWFFWSMILWPFLVCLYSHQSQSINWSVTRHVSHNMLVSELTLKASFKPPSVSKWEKIERKKEAEKRERERERGKSEAEKRERKKWVGYNRIRMSFRI